MAGSPVWLAMPGNGTYLKALSSERTAPSASYSPIRGGSELLTGSIRTSSIDASTLARSAAAALRAASKPGARRPSRARPRERRSRRFGCAIAAASSAMPRR